MSYASFGTVNGCVGGNVRVREKPVEVVDKLHTSPKDLKDNDPSCLLLGCACASFGRITSSAYIVTCRKLFTA